MRKRLLILPLLILSLSNLFTQNSSAVSLTTNVRPTGNSWVVGANGRCTLIDPNGLVVTLTTDNAGVCTVPSTPSGAWQLVNYYGTTTIPAKKGSYYETLVSILDSGQNVNVPHQSLVSKTIGTEYHYWYVNDWESLTKDQFWTECNNYDQLANSNDYGCSNTTINRLGSSSAFYKFSLAPINDGNFAFQLGSPYFSGASIFAYVFSGAQIVTGRIFELSPIEDSAASELQEQNDKDDQDRANIESQQDSTSSDADSAQSDSESTGTTLLAGFSAFNSAVSSANPSNCNIDFNIMGYIQGGTVDLCHLNLPPQLQVIGSITMIVFVVPLSVITAKRFISLMRSFQS